LTAHWGSSRWLTEPFEGENVEREEVPQDVVDAFTGEVKDVESKSAGYSSTYIDQHEEYLKSRTHCLHVDGKTVKGCRRMVYRKSGYCYVHQRE
jgi:hypothetical protein